MKRVKRKPFIPSSTHFQTWPSVDPQAPAPSASWESWQTGSCHCWPLSWRAELRCWPFPLWCKHGSLSGTLVAPGRQKIYFIRSATAGIEFPTGKTKHYTHYGKGGIKILVCNCPWQQFSVNELQWKCCVLWKVVVFYEMYFFWNTVFSQMLLCFELQGHCNLGKS